MPRRQPVALAALLLVAACSSGGDGRPADDGPVAVPVPTASAPLVVSTCTKLLAGLPQSLGDGLERRQVTGDPTRTAAWGSPPVTLECGAALPIRDEPPFQVAPNDDGPFVTFTTRDVGAATRFTTAGRAVTVAVEVPDADDSQVLVPLVPALRTLPTPQAAPGS